MQTHETDAAVNLAASAARMPPRAFRAALTSATSSTAFHVTAEFTTKHRTVALRVAPAPFRTPSSSRIPDPASLDPWAPVPELLETAIVACPACDGAGFASCGSCDGTGTTSCGRCGGKGRHSAGEPCPSCTGSGRASCGCVDGKDSCDDCAASGVITAWLEIVESQAIRMVTDGDPGLASAPVDLEWSGPVAGAPVEASTFLQPLVPATRSSERVDTVRLTVRRVDRTIVAFRLAGVDGRYEIEGGTVTSALDDGRGVRTRMLAVGVAAGAAWAAAVWVAFVVRSPTWFLVTPGSGALIAFGIVLPVVGGVLGSELGLPSRGRAAKRAGLAAALAVALAVQAAFALSGGPSVAAAEAALAAGDLDSAERTARTAIGLGVETDRAMVVVDGVAAERFAATTDLVDAARVAAEGFVGDAARASALDQLVDRVVSRAKSNQAAGDALSSAGLVALLPAPQRADPRARAVLASADLLQLDACIGALDAECAATAIASAGSHGAAAAELDARRATADRTAAGIARPLWAAILNRKNKAHARHEACSALLAPVSLAAVAGTPAFRPTRAELDKNCSGLTPEKR